MSKYIDVTIKSLQWWFSPGSGGGIIVSINQTWQPQSAGGLLCNKPQPQQIVYFCFHFPLDAYIAYSICFCNTFI